MPRGIREVLSTWKMPQLRTWVLCGINRCTRVGLDPGAHPVQAQGGPAGDQSVVPAVEQRGDL
jgi:hypothetical protein